MEKQQREFLLRRQMDAIRKELGDNDGDDIEGYRTRIAETPLSDEARKEAEREVNRLAASGGNSAESSTIRTYLDTLLVAPLGQATRTRCWTSTSHATMLEADHAGLDEVKARILEYLAVRKFRRERDISDERAGAILALVGPPGVGKTSLGESIAQALGRKFQRMSLGGVRDEAEIRGHRRTYVGALPGRLVRALRDAGTMNPVILLDEVDKLGADWRGDPSSALLEVLDPAQNSTFRDHYLDLEVDLSQVLFLATANVAEHDPGPLLDRLEVIRSRRLHRGREGRHRGELPRAAPGRRATACSRARSTIDDRRRAPHGRRLHPRGGRPLARARARRRCCARQPPSSHRAS